MPKFPATAIEILWSEAIDDEDVPAPFTGPDCWDQADAWLTAIEPPDLGYYKTKYRVTFANDIVFEERYDIEEPRVPLAVWTHRHATAVADGDYRWVDHPARDSFRQFLNTCHLPIPASETSTR